MCTHVHPTAIDSAAVQATAIAVLSKSRIMVEVLCSLQHRSSTIFLLFDPPKCDQRLYACHRAETMKGTLHPSNCWTI